MQIVISALDPALLKALQEQCLGLDNVTIHQGSIFDIACDAVVSPANSFGFMDGGIDAQYVDRFGMQVQDRVRLAILNHHHGELLVGAAEVVATSDAEIPWLIASPTMRVPMRLDRETVNPYLATRAAILLARHGVSRDGAHAGEPIRDHIRTIAFPGMGTGVGRVAPEIAARQMRAAIERHQDGPSALPHSWADASVEHQLLYTDKPRRLQE